MIEAITTDKVYNEIMKETTGTVQVVGMLNIRLYQMIDLLEIDKMNRP